jgi:hypothetical protein
MSRKSCSEHVRCHSVRAHFQARRSSPGSGGSAKSLGTRRQGSFGLSVVRVPIERIRRSGCLKEIFRTSPPWRGCHRKTSPRWRKSRVTGDCERYSMSLTAASAGSKASACTDLLTCRQRGCTPAGSPVLITATGCFPLATSSGARIAIRRTAENTAFPPKSCKSFSTIRRMWRLALVARGLRMRASD